MAPTAAIVHLIGYPAAGKYTIAQALAEAADVKGRRYVVVDNHHTTNVIFSVIDVDGVRPVPPSVWDRVGEVREALYKAIEEFSPSGWSFVFTNVLTAGLPRDEAVISRLRRLAAARGHPYVPVILRCDRDEILRRVKSADREGRMKWIDPEAVRTFMKERPELARPEGPCLLELDVTAMRPDHAAARILDHIDHL